MEWYKFPSKIEVRFTYTEDEHAFIKSLGKLKAEMWDEVGLTSSQKAELRVLKENIKTRLIGNQGKHCAYCGLSLELSPRQDREHIAPKAKDPDFMFEPENLVMSCYFCNQSKTTTHTIDVHNIEYSKCTFQILHPYRDCYSNHLDFDIDNDGLIYVAKDKDPRTKKTIYTMGLDDPSYTFFRGALICAKYNPRSKEKNVEIKEIMNKTRKSD